MLDIPSQLLTERLQLKDEKNLLIQGMPSSIEKQFTKLSFAKNVTPLLKTRKIDFALLFAVNKKQLQDILLDVIPALHENTKLWIAYPKLTSKITSDLTRDTNWEFISMYGYQGVRSIALDNVWTAVRFRKPDCHEKKPVNFSRANPAVGIDFKKRIINIPKEMSSLLEHSKKATSFFDSLSFTNKREYVEWILSAKKEETRSRRLESTLIKLESGKKNPSEK